MANLKKNEKTQTILQVKNIHKFKAKYSTY